VKRIAGDQGFASNLEHLQLLEIEQLVKLCGADAQFVARFFK
jgi:hypothetical protein